LHDLLLQEHQASNNNWKHLLLRLDEQLLPKVLLLLLLLRLLHDITAAGCSPCQRAPLQVAAVTV
jgi:hypothetical protein